MKKYLVLFITFFLISCENNKNVASSGEPMWVVLNHVKADKRQQFEKFIYEILLPALEESAKSDFLFMKTWKSLLSKYLRLLCIIGISL